MLELIDNVTNEFDISEAWNIIRYEIMKTSSVQKLKQLFNGAGELLPTLVKGAFVECKQEQDNLLKKYREGHTVWDDSQSQHASGKTRSANAYYHSLIEM
eukprot:GHVO01064455.1.p2 GENE.GHVO01064455.1~~GHVO01064455.1.p2  ORF type:complete len:100 (+),score=10.54 GHVO01064455.1:637-936(+)